MPYRPLYNLAPEEMSEAELRKEVAYLRAHLNYLKQLHEMVEAEQTVVQRSPAPSEKKD